MPNNRDEQNQLPPRFEKMGKKGGQNWVMGRGDSMILKFDVLRLASGQGLQGVCNIDRVQLGVTQKIFKKWYGEIRRIIRV